MTVFGFSHNFEFSLHQMTISTNSSLVSSLFNEIFKFQSKTTVTVKSFVEFQTEIKTSLKQMVVP